MESSKIPLHKWVLAFHLLCSSKKGFSALPACNASLAWVRIARLGSCCTASAMRSAICRRAKLSGDGRSGRNVCRRKAALSAPQQPARHGQQSAGHRAGRARRIGPVKAGRVRRYATLHNEIITNVERTVTIMTDEMASYGTLAAALRWWTPRGDHSRAAVRSARRSGLQCSTRIRQRVSSRWSSAVTMGFITK